MKLIIDIDKKEYELRKIWASSDNLCSPKFRVEKYDGDWEYEEVDLCPSCLIELDRFIKEKRP